MYKSRLIRKIRLISNSMTSQPGKETIAIHIFPNISRSKGRSKCGREAIPKPFFKNSKIEHISGSVV